MRPDTLAWLASELGLDLVEAPDVESLVGELAEIGLVSEGGDVRRLAEQAHAGIPGAATVRAGDRAGRLVVWPEPGAGLRAVFAPTAGSVARRAAAAERAAGVTHEVANALTAIAGWSRLAASGGPLPERTRHALGVVQDSAMDALASARTFLRSMRDAARSSYVPAASACDLREIVSACFDALRPAAEQAGVALRNQVPDGVAIAAQPLAARTVIANLAKNAIEAMDGRGGSVTVTARVSRGDAWVVIRDDGPGMDAGTRDRVFERYFSTKAEGTGIGLAIVRDAVDRLGGSISVDSAPGRGTRFDLRIPLTRAEDRRRRPVVRTTSGVLVRPSPLAIDVLLVEDDDAMRSMVRTALELRGARVVACACFAEAERTPGAFDLALVDLALGDGRGDALIALLRREARVRRAILLTGSSEPPLHPGARPHRILRKPFELDDLTAAVEAVALEAPETGSG